MVRTGPSLWWQAACDCIREVLYRYPETAAQIAVIGACGQMHGTVLLDEQGELVETGRCYGMINAASRRLMPLSRAKVGKSGWRI